MIFCLGFGRIFLYFLAFGINTKSICSHLVNAFSIINFQDVECPLSLKTFVFRKGHLNFGPRGVNLNDPIFKGSDARWDVEISN